jgi:hypothetical protein
VDLERQVTFRIDLFRISYLELLQYLYIYISVYVNMVNFATQALEEFGIPDALELGYANVTYPFLLLLGGIIAAVALLLVELFKCIYCF